MRRARCTCTYGECCDSCWKPLKADKCRTKGCANPDGHACACGPTFPPRNERVIVITAAMFLGGRR